MKTDIVYNAILAYPGMAFSAAAATLWAARYVYKIKMENDLMKAQDMRGEIAAITKIQDMNEFLDQVAYDERSQVNQVESELIQRQVNTLKQKTTLNEAHNIMQQSIQTKEDFHNQLLDQFEELEEKLADFDQLKHIKTNMENMKNVFIKLQTEQSEVVQNAFTLIDQLQTTQELTQTLAREVGA
ncbi:MAG: hypothetical protein L7S56_08300 [Candidatus Poseidonia sp.]|nr:hypothetical protein [Poseidonia sp.]